MIHLLLQERLQEAARQVLPDADVSGMLVRPCPDPKFGDYQCNALMALAKERKMNPRQLATDVLARFDVSAWCEKVELAGAGFINFRLRISALEQALRESVTAELPFVQKAKQPRTIVIDFSSPNVAKPMHVGHIRSTILGDCLARTLRLLGHRVITDNHIGDWGTQFGYILVVWKSILRRGHEKDLKRQLDNDPIGTMGHLYAIGRHGIPNEPENLAETETIPDDQADAKAREELVELQAGDEENLRIWHEMIQLSQVQFDTIYARLNVKFILTLGESFYNSRLKPLVEELVAKGIARESEGAIAIFFDDVPKLKDHPALIRKSDGGFNYTTTDLATLDYRFSGEVLKHPNTLAVLGKLDPPVHEVIYVTDGRQQLHFMQVFAAFHKRHGESGVKLAHVWFGSILGEDGKPLKTRSKKIRIGDLFQLNTQQFSTQAVARVEIESLTDTAGRFFSDRRDQIVDWNQIKEEIFKTPSGDYIKLQDLRDSRGNYLIVPSSPASVQLADLLDEAEERAYRVVAEKNPELGEAKKNEIARVVGIGAVKYADLLPNRQSDYIFSWDKMLALEGNTAPYLLYAFTRTQSLARKARESGVIESTASELRLVATEEIALAKHLLKFGLVLESVADEYRPNFLCNYLYELAGFLSRFWESCPVLKSAEPERSSRLMLSRLTASVLKQGLEVLGIETTEQM